MHTSTCLIFYRKFQTQHISGIDRAATDCERDALKQERILKQTQARNCQKQKKSQNFLIYAWSNVLNHRSRSRIRSDF